MGLQMVGVGGCASWNPGMCAEGSKSWLSTGQCAWGTILTVTVLPAADRDMNRDSKPDRVTEPLQPASAAVAAAGASSSDCGRDALATAAAACAVFTDPTDSTACSTPCFPAAQVVVAAASIARHGDGCADTAAAERQLATLVATCEQQLIATTPPASSGPPACATCAELGWPVATRLNFNRDVCGGSDVLRGGDPNSNDGNDGCQAGVGHAAALATCAALGARLCTVAEVLAGEGSGTGCGHDDELVWTSSRRSAFAICTADEGMIVSGRIYIPQVHDNNPVCVAMF